MTLKSFLFGFTYGSVLIAAFVLVSASFTTPDKIASSAYAATGAAIIALLLIKSDTKL